MLTDLPVCPQKMRWSCICLYSLLQGKSGCSMTPIQNQSRGGSFQVTSTGTMCLQYRIKVDQGAPFIQATSTGTMCLQYRIKADQGAPFIQATSTGTMCLQYRIKVDQVALSKQLQQLPLLWGSNYSYVVGLLPLTLYATVVR